MEQTEKLFLEIRSTLISEHSDVHGGKMMSSEGIQFKGKNFAFFHKGAMTFRLGREFDPGSEGIHKYELLNPFKNKPPLKDWFVISADYREKWPVLAKIALAKISG